MIVLHSTALTVEANAVAVAIRCGFSIPSLLSPGCRYQQVNADLTDVNHLLLPSVRQCPWTGAGQQPSPRAAKSEGTNRDERFKDKREPKPPGEICEINPRAAVSTDVCIVCTDVCNMTSLTL